MVRRAIEGEAKFAVDDCELRRPPPSFTIDTIELLRQRHPDTEFYYFIGEDNLAGLTSWHRFEELEKMVEFVVLDRRGFDNQDGLPGHPAPHRHFRNRNQETSC